MECRGTSRRRGFDFLVEWLPQHHTELLIAPDLARVLLGALEIGDAVE